MSRICYLGTEILDSVCTTPYFSCGSDELVGLLIVSSEFGIRPSATGFGESRFRKMKARIVRLFSTQLEIFRASRNAKEEGLMHAVVALAKVCIK